MVSPRLSFLEILQEPLGLEVEAVAVSPLFFQLELQLADLIEDIRVYDAKLTVFLDQHLLSVDKYADLFDVGTQRPLLALNRHVINLLGNIFLDFIHRLSGLVALVSVMRLSHRRNLLHHWREWWLVDHLRVMRDCRVFLGTGCEHAVDSDWMLMVRVVVLLLVVLLLEIVLELEIGLWPTV